MENIYSYEWKGIKTGWDYRVLFSASGSTELTDTNEIKLPRGAFSLKKTSWKFKEYRIGLCETKTLEADVELSLLGDAQFDDFVSMLYDPLTEITRSIYTKSFNYSVGTRIEFFIKFNKNSDESINIWRKQFDGCIREDQNITKAVRKPVYKIVAEDKYRAATDQATFLAISSVNTVDDAERPGYIEWVDAVNDLMILQYAGVNQSILFQPLSVISTYIETLAKAILRDIDRNQALDFDFTLPMPTFYRQVYDSVCIRGTELSAAELYVASTIYYDVTPVGGLTNSDDGDGINSNFQSVWDFLNDHYESCLRAAWTIPDIGFVSAAIGSFYASEHIAVIDIRKLRDIEITKAAKLVKSVTSSLYESRDGDVSSYPTKDKPGSRNQKEFTVPVFFNNYPSQSEFKQWLTTYLANSPDLITWLGGISANAFTAGGQSIRRTGLFYKEQPAFCATPQFFRVHENAKLLLKPGYYTDDLYPLSDITVAASEMSNASAIVTRFQVESGLPATLAESLQASLSKRKQTTAKIKSQIDYLTDFQPGGGAGYLWDDPNTIYNFALSDIDARDTNEYDKWFALSCEVDYEN